MNVTIEVTGFESNRGKAFVEIVNEEGKAVSQLVLPITQKKVFLTLTLPEAKKYGFRVFHDENNNKKLDKNLVGYPLEKWGVSNGARPAFRAPTTDEILVSVKDGDQIKVFID